MNDALSIIRPNENALPLVFDSPHSGCVYPADFHYACTFDDLQTTEDKYIDDLFAGAPLSGASLLLAHFPRCYIDVNRAVDDIDPALLAGPWPEGKIAPTSRSDAGIGLIRRLIKPGLPVYARPLKSEQIIHRIENYYVPYFSALEGMIQDLHYRFGQVWHVNCHSMPAATAIPRQPTAMQGFRVKPLDFVIGDRDGTSCSLEFSHGLRDFIKSMGYSVGLNDPFKGVEIIRRTGIPTRGRHAVQLEVNKSLYMNEETFEKSENYPRLKYDIDRIIDFCERYTRSQLTSLAAD